MSLASLNREQRAALQAEQQSAYARLQAQNLHLDLTRGKPSAAQLDLSNALLSLPGEGDYTDSTGTDTRNYGGGAGLTDLREIFADLLGVPVPQLVAADNSSLALMHDTLVFALLHGVPGEDEPWFGRDVSFLCPVPGYDRHFALCEDLGVRMVPVELGAHGPDVDEVARLVAADRSIRGMWVVPTYANPTGVVYDEATTRALLAMDAPAGFRLWWDNAYAVHHLTDAEPAPLDVLGLAQAAGNPDRVFVFGSTSKISFAGAGVAFFGSSPANVAWYLVHSAKRSIGPDKVNHLRHVRHFGNAAAVRALMRAHRAILAPKFALVLETLERRLGPYDVASWTHPAGGYFVSLDVADGTATRVIALARDIGVALTPAGSAFPYGHDPRDRNIRLAPSFPTEADLAVSMDAVATCVLLAALEQLAAA